MGIHSLTACLLLPSLLAAAQPGPEDRLRVFPGAKGFGVRTPAGRGGRIVRVTNLNPEGAGSLREAVSGKGSRIVVFEVAGVMDLQGRDIEIVEPYLTLAGQTAPAPGITLIRGSVILKTHDVLIRHLRIRPGRLDPTRTNGWEPGIAATGHDAFNIVVDHCSVSWTMDEGAAVTGPRFEGPLATARNITFSHCIFAEALFKGGRGKGERAGGSLVDDNSTAVAFIGNLYAHNFQRNPHFKANTTGIVVNNVVYDAGRAAIQLDWPVSDWNGHPPPDNPRVSVIGNVLLYGPSSNEALALVSRKGDAYLADNQAFDISGTPTAITAGLISVLNERPIWPRGLMPMPASRTVDVVLKHAGARPKERDEVDKRIVSDVREHKGHLIASQDEVGGYPKATMTRRRIIVPVEDLDEWLAKLAAEVE